MTRIGIFGCGVVAPRSPDIDAFATNLDAADSWLTPFDGFGASNFLSLDQIKDLVAYVMSPDSPVNK